MVPGSCARIRARECRRAEVALAPDALSSRKVFVVRQVAGRHARVAETEFRRRRSLDALAALRLLEGVSTDADAPGKDKDAAPHLRRETQLQQQDRRDAVD